MKEGGTANDRPARKPQNHDWRGVKERIRRRCQREGGVPVKVEVDPRPQPLNPEARCRDLPDQFENPGWKISPDRALGGKALFKFLFDNFCTMSVCDRVCRPDF